MMKGRAIHHWPPGQLPPVGTRIEFADNGVSHGGRIIAWTVFEWMDRPTRTYAIVATDQAGALPVAVELGNIVVVVE